jgi:hypothetical protein
MKPYPYLCSINLKNYIMRTKQVYIVQYNDCYGNGTDKKLEAVIESKDDFKSWLEQHNDNRRMDCISDDDFIEESEEEFDLIQINMFDFNIDRFCCDNCGGGFIKEEMDFDVNDQDLCKNCNHKTFNEAPYGEE